MEQSTTKEIAPKGAFSFLRAPTAQNVFVAIYPDEWTVHPLIEDVMSHYYTTTCRSCGEEFDVKDSNTLNDVLQGASVQCPNCISHTCEACGAPDAEFEYSGHYYCNDYCLCDAMEEE